MLVKTTSVTRYRSTLMTLASLILLGPATASAYTSTGSDGVFAPTTSIVLDVSQQVFNFTEIDIPPGVDVSFSGLSSVQPLEFLATGTINIAGILDVGANNFWIETPGSITVSGSIVGTGSALTVDGGTVLATGAINDAGGSLSVGSGGIVISSGGGLTSDCCSVTPPVPEPSRLGLVLIGLTLLAAAVRRQHRV